MKKVLKILGIAVAVIILLIVGGFIYFNASYPKVDPPKNIKIEATAERLSRGEYLANHVAICIDCHSERDWTKFAGPIKSGTNGSGGEVFDENMGFPGTVVSKNLTPANIGSWTDGELLRAITCGVTKDNKALFPLMPYMHYNNLTQEDVYSIITYIRLLQPQEKEIPETKLNFPLNFLVKTMPIKSYTPTKEVDRTDSVKYGKYLVTIASCSECHTQAVKGEPVPGMYLAGGRQFNFPSGIITSANITPDAASGIGNWKKIDFINRFRLYNGEEAHNIPVNPEKDFNTPMPWLMYSGMTDEDLGAIYDYLRTVKPVDNRINRFTPNKTN